MNIPKYNIHFLAPTFVFYFIVTGNQYTLNTTMPTYANLYPELALSSRHCIETQTNGLGRTSILNKCE